MTGQKPTGRIAAVLVVLLVAGMMWVTARQAVAADLLLMGKVRQAQANGQPEKAVELLDNAVRDVEPGDAVMREALLYELAKAHVAADHDFDAAYMFAKLAILKIKRLGKAHPDVSGIFEAAGQAYERAGDPVSAVEAYKRALDIDRAHYGLGNASVLSLLKVLARLSGELGKSEDHLTYSRLAEDGKLMGDRPKGVLLAGRGDTAASNYGEADANSFTRVKIFYATDRALTGSARPNDFFGAGRGEMSIGTAEVSVPASHKPGALEVPSMISLELSENPERHVVLQRIVTLDHADAFARMREHLAGNSSDEAFVFIHGYNVSFSWAARRTAQLAYDLNFEGLPILYSWPSSASALDYLADSAVVRLSGRHLSGFLEQVVAQSGAKRIHLIGHSMGNRALTDALELFALKHAGKPANAPFEQVLFTAPDVDAGLFAEMIKTIRPVAKRLTLYASDSDLALIASRRVHGGSPRAGQGGLDVLVSDVIDTVDMTALGGDVLGHNYFSDHASALTDMLSLFWRDAPPTRRCGMIERSRHDRSYWLFNPQGCRGAVALSALGVIKSKGLQATEFAKAMVAKWRQSGNARAVAEWQEIQTVVGAMIADGQ